MPKNDPKAGFFGFDRKLRLADLRDGTATTLALAETAEGGPWLVGGRATMRGLSGDRLLYLQPGGPFTSHHTGVMNLLFADGSVRPTSVDTAPDVIEA